MHQAVAVTIDARQASGEMNVLILYPFVRAVVNVDVRVTEIATLVGDFSDNVEEDPALVVEGVLAISDSRGNLFGAGRLRHKGVITIGHVPGKTGDGSEAAGCGGGPAEVLTSYLQGGLGLVVGGVGIVAGEAVDFELAGDLLSENLFGVVAVKLSHPAAGQMSAEVPDELPVGQAKLLWFEGPRPGTMGEGNLRSCACVDKNPGLTRSAGSDVRFSGVKVPACADDVIAVTEAAGLAGRKRKKRVIVGEDFVVYAIALLVVEIDAVNVSRPATVSDVTEFSAGIGWGIGS